MLVPDFHKINGHALTAATDVIIPVQADKFSLDGVGQIYRTITQARKYSNRELKLRGILLTRHNARAVVSRYAEKQAELAAAEMGTFVYRTYIRECVALKEIQYRAQQNIYEYDEGGNAAADYTAFVDEFIERGKSHG